MASYNKVILIGNVTRDPEVRYISSGSAVTEIGLAVNRFWTDRNTNERKEETTFVDVTLWGRTAEIAGEYLSKGRPVLIEGRLQLDQWEDRETGQKRSKLRVVGETLQFLGSRHDGSAGGGGHQNSGGGQQGSGEQPRPSAPSSAAVRETGGVEQSSGHDGGSGDRNPAEAFYDNAESNPPEDEVPF